MVRLVDTLGSVSHDVTVPSVSVVSTNHQETITLIKNSFDIIFEAAEKPTIDSNFKKVFVEMGYRIIVKKLDGTRSWK